MEPLLQSNERVSVAGVPDFRVLFESVPGLLIALLPDRPKFTIAAASDDFLRAFRKSRAEVGGRSLFELFARELGSAQAPMLANLRASLDRVLDSCQPETLSIQGSGIHRLTVEADGFQERSWTAASSPVVADKGQVQYILLRLEEIAKAVSQGPQEEPAEVPPGGWRDAEQRLSAIESRFRLAFSEAPIGMAITDPQGRIVEVNQAYTDMLGYSAEELLSLKPAHFTHPDDVAISTAFAESLVSGQVTRAVLEKRYIRKNGEPLWARVSAARRRDASGSPTEIIAAIEDVTERRRVEERLRAIYDGTYEYIGLLAPDGTLLEANRALLEFGGNSREQVIGRPFWKVPWFAFTSGAPETVRGCVTRAAAGEFVRYEAVLHRPSGDAETFDISLHPIRDNHGEVILIVPEGRNISERTALQLRNEFLVKLDDLTRPLTDAFEITQTAARLLGEHLQVNRCAYADVEADEDTFNLTGDFNRGVPSIVGRYTFTQFGADCLRLMREGKPYLVEDSETDPRADSIRQSYRQTMIRSVICVPLLKAGRFVAAMAVHQVTPRTWKQDEVELVSLVANRCWESIERVHVTRELREREQRFRFLAESIPQMVWTATPDGSIDYINGQAAAYFGIEQEAIFGSGWLDVVHPEDRKRVIERWQQSIGTGDPYENAFRFRRGSDGAWRWHLVRALPLMRAGGEIVQWFGACTDIEDQKQAEANLQQQWETFDTVLSHTPDFAYTLDLSGRFTYVNRSLLALWQKSFHEAIGKNFFELDYPPELASRLQSQIQRVIETRQPVRDQTPFTGIDGETRFYEYIFVPVLDAEGAVESVAGSTRDMTEQNRVAEQIEEDRRRWRELLFQTPAAVAILRGAQHTFEWVNDNFTRLVNRPAAALVGRPVLAALPEVESQMYINLLDRVYSTGEIFQGHESLIRFDKGDGSLEDVYVNFVYAPTRDLAGNVEGIFVHATDVTGMVAARKQVEDSERQFRTLAETIPHLAWMADESGSIFWYNRRWFDYTGATFSDMEGWGWQSVHDPAVLPEVLRNWQAAIVSGQTFEMIFPLRGADGDFRTFLTRVEPVRDNEGKVVRWFGTNTDITTQRRTEEELRRMNRELEEFAYVASHDLQEPLRMVNIYTDLILRTVGERGGKVEQYSSFVRQGVLRMEALIHDLLTFSRTVHSDDVPAGEADLSLSLQEAMSVLKNRIEESGASVEVGILPLARGDTAQLAHVFQNVLSNALKYCKPDLPPRIRISAELEEGRWVVSVQDNGIGFEMRYAQRIFGLFKRLHKDEYPGTGLGLAICKRIVERYGGRMWAEGEPGVGSTFRFSLPAIEGR